MKMGRLKKLRILLGLIKDKTSIIKATLSAKRHKSIRISVVQATTHGAIAPPSDNRIDSVLSLGSGSRLYDAGYTCIEALMSRLHRTKNASVALKSLFLLHIIITKGAFIIKNQLSLYLSHGGLNCLNLSKFREENCDSWVLVPWVRWYSAVLEHNFRISRFLEYSLSSSLSTKEKEEKFWGFLSKDILGETDILVDFVEATSQFPDSLDLQKNDLIYEIVRMVSDDYRAVQLEILIRVGELRSRIPSLSDSELTQFLGELMRFESCRQRFNLLFINRNRNEGLWELVGKTKKEIAEVMDEKGEGKLVKIESCTYDSSGWTRFDEVDQLVEFDASGGWLGSDQLHLAVSTL